MEEKYLFIFTGCVIVQIVLSVFLFIDFNTEPSTASLRVRDSFRGNKTFSGLSTVITDGFFLGKFFLREVGIISVFGCIFVLMALSWRPGFNVFIKTSHVHVDATNRTELIVSHQRFVYLRIIFIGMIII